VSFSALTRAVDIAAGFSSGPAEVTATNALKRVNQGRMSDAELFQLSAKVGEELQRRGIMLVSAESCTGGLVAKLVTDIAGSSGWFERSFVTYTDAAKQEMLDVPADMLRRVGAVSQEVVLAMAAGAIKHSHAGVSVAISGIAGPGGETPGKPVGTVWFAWGQIATEGACPALQASCLSFAGGRETVRYLAAQYALQGVLERLV